MTPEQQWLKLILTFGENAFQMCELWQLNTGIFLLSKNAEVEAFFKYKPTTFELTFKQSAALPFDLAAAIAGDEVEWFDGEEWLECKFCGVTKYHAVKIYCKKAGSSFEFLNYGRLRMKHPRRIGIDYSQFEDKV